MLQRLKLQNSQKLNSKIIAIELEYEKNECTAPIPHKQIFEPERNIVIVAVIRMFIQCCQSNYKLTFLTYNQLITKRHWPPLGMFFISNKLKINHFLYYAFRLLFQQQQKHERM